jgi:AcrR family transcriptional regulator
VAESLPPAVSTAWGLRDAPTRPRPRGLSLERIVQAGISVATTDGLAAVSMNRVAAELGAATMSLYRHLSAKDELLAHMVDTAYADVPAHEDAETWREGLTRWARAQLSVLRRHAWVLRVPISGPPLMPNHVRWFERGLASLRDTGLREAEKPSVLSLVGGFVRNHATLEADLLNAARASGVAPEAIGAQYAGALERLTDAARFPGVQALLTSGVFLGRDTIGDEFQFGLDRILDGIDALVRARNAG